MANITKVGGGDYSASESVAGATVSLTLTAPPPGCAIVLKKIVGFMSGGTSTEIRLNYQSSTVVGSPDPVGINRDIERKVRAGVGAPGSIDQTFPGKGLVGGNGHQIDVILTGNVADSTLANLFLIYSYIAIR